MTHAIIKIKPSTVKAENETAQNQAVVSKFAKLVENQAFFQNESI